MIGNFGFYLDLSLSFSLRLKRYFHQFFFQILKAMLFWTIFLTKHLGKFGKNPKMLHSSWILPTCKNFVLLTCIAKSAVFALVENIYDIRCFLQFPWHDTFCMLVGENKSEFNATVIYYRLPALANSDIGLCYELAIYVRGSNFMLMK